MVEIELGLAHVSLCRHRMIYHVHVSVGVLNCNVGGLHLASALVLCNLLLFISQILVVNSLHVGLLFGATAWRDALGLLSFLFIARLAANVTTLGIGVFLGVSASMLLLSKINFSLSVIRRI